MKHDKYEERILVCIKVMMFEHYESFIETDELPELFCELFEHLLQNVHGNEDGFDRQMTVVSDTIFLSYDALTKDNVIWAVKDVYDIQRWLLEYGFVCKGVMKLGKVVHTSDIMYGPGLQDLESSLALEIVPFPVVRVYDEIFDYMKGSSASSYLDCLEEREFGFFVPFCDEQEKMDCDFLSSAIERLSEMPKYLEFEYEWLKQHFEELNTMACQL